MSQLLIPDCFHGDYPSFRGKVGRWKWNRDAVKFAHKMHVPLGELTVLPAAGRRIDIIPA
jgi:hypothetical protein